MFIKGKIHFCICLKDFLPCFKVMVIVSYFVDQGIFLFQVAVRKVFLKREREREREGERESEREREERERERRLSPDSFVVSASNYCLGRQYNNTLTWKP